MESLLACTLFNACFVVLKPVSHRLQDLKKYFDSCNGDLDPETVKVRNKTMTTIRFDRMNVFIRTVTYTPLFSFYRFHRLAVLKVDVLIFFLLPLAVIHVPAAERPRFLSQSKRPAQRSEAAESSHKQSECLQRMPLQSPRCCCRLLTVMCVSVLRTGSWSWLTLGWHEPLASLSGVTQQRYVVPHLAAFTLKPHALAKNTV